MHSMHSVHSMHTAYYWVALCRSDSECNCEWKACASSPPPLTTPSSPHCITLHQSHSNPKTAASSALWIHHSPDSSIFNCCTLLLEEQFYAVRTFHAPLMVRSGRRALYIAVTLREKYLKNRRRQNLDLTHPPKNDPLMDLTKCKNVTHSRFWWRLFLIKTPSLTLVDPQRLNTKLSRPSVALHWIKIRNRIQNSKCPLS